MYKGEKRKLYVTVTSDDELPFQIIEARYEVWNCDMDMREAEGRCGVDDHTLGITICPAHTEYIRWYIFKIADETVIQKILIRGVKHRYGVAA